MSSKSNVVKIKPGAYLSETQYYKVISKSPNSVEVENERGLRFYIGNSIVSEGIFSSDQFEEELKVSRTELIELFRSVGDTVFTVCFNKQPKADEINAAIAQANKGKIIPIKDLQKIVKDAYKGEERILIGYLVKTETGFGRSIVIDLEADRSKSTPDWDSRLRQVDHRTLNWLIYKNKKYMVK